MIDKEIDYKVEYRSVKNPRLEFRTKQLTVILPHGHNAEIVLNHYKKWILKKHRSIQESLQKAQNMELSARSTQELKDMVYMYAADACRDLGVEVNKILFRKMRTKWASCTSRNVKSPWPQSCRQLRIMSANKVRYCQARPALDSP